MIRRVKSGLQLHVEAVVKEAKKRDKLISQYKKIDSAIEIAGKENVMSKLKNIDPANIIAKCLKHKKIKGKFDKEQLKKVFKVAMINAFLVASNPFILVSAAEEKRGKMVEKMLQETSVSVNSNPNPGQTVARMFNQGSGQCKDVFQAFLGLGAWIIVGSFIYEVTMNLIRKSNKSIVSIMIKYILTYIAIASMPTILKLARILILGS